MERPLLASSFFEYPFGTKEEAMLGAHQSFTPPASMQEEEEEEEVASYDL